LLEKNAAKLDAFDSILNDLPLADEEIAAIRSWILIFKTKIIASCLKKM
jgi:hypothetical protein